MSYANSPPKYMTTLIPKLLSLFVMNDKVKSLRSGHLLIIGRANILILIIIIVITETIIIVLALRSLWRWRRSEATHVSLS